MKHCVTKIPNKIPTITHQNFVVSNFLSNVSNAFFLPGCHCVVRRESCNLEEEVRHHLFALQGEIDFGMKLNAINARLLVVNASDDVRRASGADFEFVTNVLDGIAVRQENCLCSLKSTESVYKKAIL